jgi:hypothetical protein
MSLSLHFNSSISANLAFAGFKHFFFLAHTAFTLLAGVVPGSGSVARPGQRDRGGRPRPGPGRAQRRRSGTVTVTAAGRA